jgi:hypothetical protein
VWGSYRSQVLLGGAGAVSEDSAGVSVAAGVRRGLGVLGGLGVTDGFPTGREAVLVGLAGAVGDTSAEGVCVVWEAVGRS